MKVLDIDRVIEKNQVTFSVKLDKITNKEGAAKLAIVAILEAMGITGFDVLLPWVTKVIAENKDPEAKRSNS